jgi:hypothetical protein
VTQNPQWPLLDYAICWAAGPAQSPTQSNFCSIKERTEGSVTVRRGKQYELDQVQPGQATLTLRNDDGVFDPDNTLSPYNGYVDPYRLLRIRAQYPATQNLLTADQATAYRASKGATPGAVLPQWVAGYNTAASPTMAVNTTPAYNYYLLAIPASSGANQGIQFVGWSVAAGQPYSFQAACSAPGGTHLYLTVQWIAADGVTVLSSASSSVLTATGVTQSLTLTNVIAPAGAAGAALIFTCQDNPALITNIACWNLQVEKSAAVTAFTQPGTWYPLFTGYVERWPQSWTSQGNYGVVNLTVVDLFANLTGQKLLAAFKADLMALNPNFLYALDEAAGSTSFADTAAKNPPVGTVGINSGRPISLGSSVQSTSVLPEAGDLTSAFLGTPGPVLTTANPYAAGNTNPMSLVALASRGTAGPPPGGGWTRIIACRNTATNTGISGNTVWAAFDAGSSASTINEAFEISLSFVSSTNYKFVFQGVCPLGPVLPASTSGVNALDGAWHLIAVSVSADNKTITFRVDANGKDTITAGAAGISPVIGINGVDMLGGQYYPAGGASQAGWTGDIALATELPTEITDAQWANLYQSWRNDWSVNANHAETSSTRYARILAWLNYTGPVRISNGLSVAYGPATDVAGALGLQVLQNVVDTEGGQHFIGADGAVVFQSRADRYNKTPTITFGENDGAGEIPYSSALTDRDPTRVANDVHVTALYSNALYRATDAASAAKFGDITFTRTVNSLDPAELTSAAGFYLYENKQVLTRLQALPIDVAGLAGSSSAVATTVWPAMLGLELGQCAAFHRRPSGAPPISLTTFVEQIAWTFDDQVTAKATLQLSSAQKHQFGTWGSNRTDSSLWGPDPGAMTVAAITAGATSLTITTAGTSPAMTNTAGSFPITILIDQEQIILTAASGSTTSPQTFTGVTRGANGTTAAAHSAGAVVSLPNTGIWGY